jgi:UDP-glucose:(heptosyl)LPS alpha-1,3-glucosyltransferase
MAVKIALVILHADTARGGAERYTLDLAASLVRRGHTVSILASSFQAGETAGARVLLPAVGARRSGRYLSFLDSVEKELAGADYEIVHAMLPVRRCDLYHPHAGIAIESVSRGHLNKSNRVARGLAWVGNRANRRRQLFAKVESRLLSGEGPPLVLCLSGLIQSVVRRNYPSLPPEKLAALFNGVDLNRFNPAVGREARKEIRARYNIAESAIIALLLAQDFERKGVGQAIEALAGVDDQRLTLVIGGRPDPARYDRLAQRLGVRDRVIFVGAVGNPVEFYHFADFFVLPTLYDPCSLVVLEALAMGLPVISTVRNGACEIMRDGQHGRILDDPRDKLALTQALGELLDAETRSRMSCACLELRPQLAQERHVDQLEAIYLRILENRSTGYSGSARHVAS